MANRTITIQLEGGEQDDGHLRLPEFIEQLKALQRALKQTERIISGSDQTSLIYRIVKLSHSSPVTVTIEAVPLSPRTDFSQATVNQFHTTLHQIGHKGTAPDELDFEALEAYREMSAALSKKTKHIAGFQVIRDSEVISIDKEFTSKIEDIIGPDEIVLGTLTGTIELLNIHNTNRFNLYPPVGPQKVACDFPVSLKHDVIAAIDRSVCVSGELRYKKKEFFPYAMNVTEIEILPNEDELPNLLDLRGIAPNATEDLNIFEFLEKVRDETW